MASCDPTLDSFIGDPGYMQPPLPGPSSHIDPHPDLVNPIATDRCDIMDDFPGNNNNIDFDDVSLSAFLSPIDTPWLSTDASKLDLLTAWLSTDASELDLLTASVDCVDPASRALHGATEFMKVYNVGRAGLHARLKVANNTQHFPTRLGFLRVPDNSSRGYQEVE